MKTLIIVCVAMFLVLGFSGLVMAEEIPGGIVYLEAGNAIYHDFTTGQKINLTADLNTVIEGPVAISEDGQSLVWFNKGDFWLRKLPDGKPQLKKTSYIPNTIDPLCFPGVKPFSFQKDTIRDLTLSPKGLRFAFQCDGKGTQYLKINKEKDIFGHPNPPPNVPSRLIPLYDVVLQNYKAVIASFRGPFGNTADLPSSCVYRLTPRGDKPFVEFESKQGLRFSGRIHYGTCGQFCSEQEHRRNHQRHSIKHDAYFPAWAKASQWQTEGEDARLLDARLLAVVLTTDDYEPPKQYSSSSDYSTNHAAKSVKWGPIVIDGDLSLKLFEIDDKFWRDKLLSPPDIVGRWEIPISVERFGGLAWKPDSSLTFLAEEKVFVISAYSIYEEIKKRAGGIAKMIERVKKGGGFNDNDDLILQPVEFARGINGGKLHWVSDDTFLFRGKDRVLYCWRQGKVERLLSPVPEEFSFCDVPPLNSLTVSSETQKPVKAENKLANMGNMGKSETLGRLMEPSNKYNPRTEFDIVVGDIKTVGSVRKIERIEGNKLMSRDLTLSILTNPLPGERSKCEYALLPTGTKLESVTNPSTIQYKTDDVMYMFHSVQMKQIIILRVGDKYVAISPIEIRQDSNGLTLIYEWKYWPATPQTEATTSQTVNPK